MKVSIIGTGYVGLASSVGLAARGHDIIGVEKRQEVIDIITSGRSPYYEEGLEPLLHAALKDGKFRVISSIAQAVQESEVTMICVGTPQADDGRIDLTAIREVSKALGDALKAKKSYHVVVVKSTVLPGTSLNVVCKEIEARSGKKMGHDFGIAMIPEFLREGSAIKDFMEPDRIVIGAEDAKAGAILRELFGKSFDAPIVMVNTKTAEMIKYTNNSFLAMCISFSNEISQICEKVGNVDAHDVMEAVVKDGRITAKAPDGSKVVPSLASYLYPGPGFGGSCFPKDLSAIVQFEREQGVPAVLIHGALDINRRQKEDVVRRVEAAMGGAKGKTVAVLGVAFKPDTDDTRESPSIDIINHLLSAGASVQAYDQRALDNARKIWGERIAYCKSWAEALKGSEMAVVVTSWDEFRKIKAEEFVQHMKTPRVFDCRRLYDGAQFAAKKVPYYCIGYRKE
ncbi:UDP-glucose 6-dehydrogenase AglM [uncultured archaeon]|nr:UDP-glucose 6-dehydrogenase AglM [uncultured archaeon]